MSNKTNGTTPLLPDTEAGKKVKARFREDRTLEAIDHLLSRIETLEKAVEGLTNLLQQGPGLIAMTGDMVDEAYRKADERGINIEQRLRSVGTIAEKLTDPKMVKRIDSLIDTAEKMPGIIAMTMDMVDAGMKTAIHHGYNPSILAETAGTANTALTKAKNEPPEKVGSVFALLRLLRDADMRNGIGFFVNFLRHFGRNIYGK